MNKNELIELIKFHCQESKKILLKFRLDNENLSKEAIKQIKQSYKMLELNLIAEITDNT